MERSSVSRSGARIVGGECVVLKPALFETSPRCVLWGGPKLRTAVRSGVMVQPVTMIHL